MQMYTNLTRQVPVLLQPTKISNLFLWDKSLVTDNQKYFKSKRIKIHNIYLSLQDEFQTTNGQNISSWFLYESNKHIFKFRENKTKQNKNKQTFI